MNHKNNSKKSVTNEDLAGLIETLAISTAKRFDGIDIRLDRIEVRLDNVEVRLDHLEGRMDRLENRVGNMDVRLEKMEIGYGKYFSLNFSR